MRKSGLREVRFDQTDLADPAGRAPAPQPLAPASDCHATGKDGLSAINDSRTEATGVRQSQGTDRIGIKREPDEEGATGSGSLLFRSP